MSARKERDEALARAQEWAKVADGARERMMRAEAQAEALREERDRLKRDTDGMRGVLYQEGKRCDDCPYPNREKCPMRCVVYLEAALATARKERDQQEQFKFRANERADRAEAECERQTQLRRSCHPLIHQEGKRMKRKGNAGENRVARELRARGALVGSMRESSDPGDLIVLVWGRPPSLVEVKANREGGPFANFRRPARAALAAAAERYGATAWIAYAPPGQPTRWIGEAEWPS